MDCIKIIPSKIYHFEYSSGVRILGRVKGVDSVNIYFYDYLYYLADGESFDAGDFLYAEREDMIKIRGATQGEKQRLLAFSIINETI